MENIRLSANLLVLRKNNFFKQEEFAKKIGVSRTTISNYEAGVSNPDLKTLLRIAKFFNITVDDLLTKDFSGTTQNVKVSETSNKDPLQPPERPPDNEKEDLYKLIATLSERLLRSKDTEDILQERIKYLEGLSSTRRKQA